MRCAVVNEFEVGRKFFIEVYQVALFSEQYARSLEGFTVHLHGARVSKDVLLDGSGKNLGSDRSVRLREDVDRG